MPKILAMILAGGEGKRLEPLTRDRAKPAVPFGGKYRIIDFVLSNFVNSGIYQIAVLTQFKAESLIDHIEHGWQRFMGNLAGDITINPAQQRVNKKWYLGTANAVFQNYNRIQKENPDVVAVFGGDHIYKMNVRQMINFHEQKGAGMTVAAVPVPVRKAAHNYGVIEVDEDYDLVGFEEKPAEPRPVPGDPDRCLVSMGNYVFNRELLTEVFQRDARKKHTGKEKLKSLVAVDPKARDRYSTHDIGADIIPALLQSGEKISVYDFMHNPVPGVSGAELGYWRDVGNIEEYYDANMDVCGIEPVFNLYNPEWPVRTSPTLFPPAKFSLASEVYNSIVAEGCITTKARLVSSVLGFDVRVEEGAMLESSVLMNGVKVGSGARLSRVIVDKYVNIPPETQIGADPDRDRKRGFTTSPAGITVVPKSYEFKK